MYLKSLIIKSNKEIIRNIPFHPGLNLIIDDTPLPVDEITDKRTGNNVGKTTVLKLISFCLGGKAEDIYKDKVAGVDDTEVKNFLEENNVQVRLILKKNLENEDSDEISILRNFRKGRSRLLVINDVPYSTPVKFTEQLRKIIFQGIESEKPTFRNLISHNLRYTDKSVSNLLETIEYGKKAQYEQLYLFMFGVSNGFDSKKENTLLNLKIEKKLLSRLKKGHEKTEYQTELSVIENTISELEIKRKKFNIGPDLLKEMNELNRIQYNLRAVYSRNEELQIRKKLVLDAKKEYNEQKSNIDLEQLHLIYNQACDKVDNIQKTFDELVKYHDSMIDEKIKFITNTLPNLELKIKSNEAIISNLEAQKENISHKVSNYDSFESLQNIITQISEKSVEKGKIQQLIDNIAESENKIEELNILLSKSDLTTSNEFKEKVLRNVNIFNTFFSSISEVLYGETYSITFKTNKGSYEFLSTANSMGSGKKQGEITCFEIAYIQFADYMKIPCLHFVLNDKKELMSANQLKTIMAYVEKNKIQFVMSILKDKLPKDLETQQYVTLTLSQKDKLFKF